MKNKPKIRKIRESLGLSQTAFGEAVGIRKMTVSHIENGHRGLSSGLAHRIQNFLLSQGVKISIDELYTGLKIDYEKKGRFSTAYKKSKKAKEIYEDVGDLVPSFLGWLIQDGNNIFAIGDISDKEILQIAGKKPVNVIKCKNYELENWNIKGED
ncbi:MAG: helix-turn-helix domain-containing protein [bacterium]